MTIKQLHQVGIGLALAGLAVTIAGCSQTTGGTAAVGTEIVVTTSSSTSAPTTPTTTRSSKPTTSSSTPTSSSETSSSMTSSSEVTSAAQPTNSAGEPWPASTDFLVIGDCYTLGAAGAVTVIDCTELHDGQVFLTDVALTGVDPSETDGQKWLDGATSACSTDFETFTGSALGAETNDYTIAVIVTPAPDGTPTVACTAVDKTGAQWAGTAESVSGSYRGIDVGDCFDYPTTLEDAKELPCDQPHDAEMYLLDSPLTITDPAAPYPTDAEWQDLSSTVCLTGFTDYTGLPFDTSTTLSFSYVYPLEPDWADVEERKMSCVVIEEDGTKLVGSKKHA